jgi:hypothetical protein
MLLSYLHIKYVTVVTVKLTYEKQGRFLVRINGAEKPLDLSGTLLMTDNRLNLACHVDKKVFKSHVFITPTDIHLFTKVSGNIIMFAPCITQHQHFND